MPVGAHDRCFISIGCDEGGGAGEVCDDDCGFILLELCTMWQ